LSKVIISLVGVKRSGKSTTASLLEYLLPEANNIAIADKLKQVCSSAFDLDLIYFNSQDLKEQPLIYPVNLKMDGLSTILENFKIDNKPVKVSSEDILEIATMKMRTPRHMLQNIGMFVRSVFGKSIHLQHLDLSSDLTIVSDVRFKNEFDYLESMKTKGYVHIPIYVYNKEAESVKDLHISEKDYLKFKDKCILLDNNLKDADDLFDKVENILIKYKKELLC
jgi:hypothetical protein